MAKSSKGEKRSGKGPRAKKDSGDKSQWRKEQQRKEKGLEEQGEWMPALGNRVALKEREISGLLDRDSPARKSRWVFALGVTRGRSVGDFILVRRISRTPA